MKIKDLQDPKYKLITDEQECCDFLDGLGMTACDVTGGLLYCFDPHSDYISEVWGFKGCVPSLDKTVTRLDS